MYRDKFTEDEDGADIEVPVDGPTSRTGWGIYVFPNLIFEEWAGGFTWNITFRFNLNGDEISTLIVPVKVE